MVRRPRLRARRAVAAAVATALLAVAAAPGAAGADAHPLHTTLAELTYDRTSVRVSLRVFEDDFSAAVRHEARARAPHAGALPDSAMFRYVAGRFALVDGGGTAVRLRGCGVRRAGDALLLCLEGRAARPLAGGRVRNALLTERFADQVNIVQAVSGGRRATLLFTAGAGPKRLP